MKFNFNIFGFKKHYPTFHEFRKNIVSDVSFHLAIELAAGNTILNNIDLNKNGSVITMNDPYKCYVGENVVLHNYLSTKESQI